MSSYSIANILNKELPRFLYVKNSLELQYNIETSLDTLKLHGVQVRAKTSMAPDEKTYNESILLLLQSFEDGSVQTLMFQKNVNYNSFINIEFEKPFHIRGNTNYSIEMKYLSEGFYFMGTVAGEESLVDGSLFKFQHGVSKYNPLTGILYSKLF